MKVKMRADGTEVNHNKRDIDGQNKETKAWTADGDSEDGRWERGKVRTTCGEPDAGNDEDKVGQVDTKMKHLRGNTYKAEDVGRDVVNEDKGAGRGARYKDGGGGRWRRNNAKEEQKETSSKSSDTEGEQEVNRAIHDKVWPGTRATARKRNVRHKEGKDDKNKGESESSAKDEESYPGGEQETNQVTWDHVWPGTRDSQRWKRVQGQARRRYADLKTTSKYLDETDIGPGYQGDAGRQVPGRDDRHDVHKAGGAGLDNKVQGVGAGQDNEEQGKGAGLDGRVQDKRGWT